MKTLSSSDSLQRQDALSKFAAYHCITDDGPWSLVMAILQRAGGTITPCGSGFDAEFGTFSLKTSIRRTDSIAAVTTRKVFTLDSEVAERDSFSLELYQSDRGLANLVDITFGPVPSSNRGVDQRELARRFLLALQWLLENAKLQESSTRLFKDIKTLTA